MRVYPWGDGIDCSMANYGGTDGCVGDTSMVGSYTDGKSPYGALDMAGNVWEWVSTLYSSYPYHASDGREDADASGSRVLRGGSWNVNGYEVRSAYRFIRYSPDDTYYDIGFRCATSP